MEKWKPLNDISEKLYLEGLHDDYEGLRLLLKGSGKSKMLRILFKINIGYRNIDESERLKKLDSFPELCENWSLFKENRSDFIDWIIEESYGKYTQNDLTNYIIATPNDFVEIVSIEPPKVEWLN